MGSVISRHDTIVRAAAESCGGYVFKTVGDSFCVAFYTAGNTLRAALEAQRNLAAEDWGEIGVLKVRMGIHVGAAEFRDRDYFGGTLNRASRIESAAHGGQILISQLAYELLQEELLDGVKFKSLGDHRLRNLDRPEHLYQIMMDGLPSDFPPPRSMEVLPNNLPVQTTSFIGREKEMETVRKLFEKTRLLTLNGTGGTGKTRLAIEFGAQIINEFPDGIWLAELVTATDEVGVVDVVAQALGVREEPGRTLRETVVNFLRGKNLMLILDNCEHVLAPVASLAAELLRTSQQLKIFTTSRHSLGIAGETTFPVPPLGIFDIRLKDLEGPDLAEKLSQYDAVKLFTARAAAVRPDFKVTNANAPAVAEICSRLDGIPLAIELAAARVRLLSVDQIATRLNDRFRLLRGGDRAGLPHQQTLQALIDWSYDLLSEPERILFRRLNVFVGGRTLEALEAVCTGDGVDEYDILDLLQQLVDKSLAMVERDAEGSPRYTITESVWHYGREKLETSGEADAMRHRHLDYFLQLAEEAAPHLEGPQQRAWLERLGFDRFNFRSAGQWAHQSGRIEDGLRLFVALHRLLELRADLESARETYEPVINHPKAAPQTLIRGKAVEAAGRLCWAQDRYDEAHKYFKEAQEIYEALGDVGNAAYTYALLAFLARGDGDSAAAEAGFTHALEVGRKIGQTYLVAVGLSGLGSVALDKGDLETARNLKEESLVLYRKLGDHWITGLILWGVGRVAIAQGDIARAREAIGEWAKITEELGNKWARPYVIEALADIELADARFYEAAVLFGAAEAAQEHFGTKFSLGEQNDHDRSVQSLKQKLSEEEVKTAWQEGRAMSSLETVRKYART